MHEKAMMMDPAEVQLAEAAVSISHSLYHLAQVEQAANPHAKLSPPPNPNSYGMGRLASVDWSGPIEPLIKRLAKASHYTFKKLGRKPAIPIIVTINTKNTPMGDILRDAAFQAHSKADVLVFPKRHVIEVRYGKGA